MQTSKLPKISIIIVTYNNERTIEECVKRIMEQDYPKHMIDYVSVDGGSSDRTKEILKKYNFRITISSVPKNAEAQRAIGILKAKNNLIVSLDADNFLPNTQWLKQMVKPFEDDEQVIHAGTMYYGYRESDTIFNRYCALFGVNDPIVFYIGKPDRAPRYIAQWSRGNVVKETKNHYIVQFDEGSLPTVGCNGVVYKRDILLKHAQSSPSKFLHIDVFVDLLRKNYNRYAIVKNEIIHDTAASLPMLLRKRILFLKTYYLRENTKSSQRRYYVFNPQKFGDIAKLILFVVYTVTFVKPLLDSIRGYIRVRDIAWFIHPVICWVYLLSYSYATTKRLSRG